MEPRGSHVGALGAFGGLWRNFERLRGAFGDALGMLWGALGKRMIGKKKEEGRKKKEGKNRRKREERRRKKNKRRTNREDIYTKSRSTARAAPYYSTII